MDVSPNLLRTVQHYELDSYRSTGSLSTWYSYMSTGLASLEHVPCSTVLVSLRQLTSF